MYFDLTDEQKAIAEMVEALLRDAMPDNRAVALFDTGVLNAELWGSISALGLGGILVPEASGGLDMGLLTIVAIQEKLGWAAAAVPVAHNALAAWLIANNGSEIQKERWLAPLISGEAIAAFALDETGLGPSGWAMEGASLTGSKSRVLWGRC